MKLALLLCGIRQAGAPGTVVKNVTICFYLGLVIASGQRQVWISYSPTFTRSLNLK